MNLNDKLFFTFYNLSYHSHLADTLIIFCAQYLAYLTLACAVLFLLCFFVTHQDWKGKRWVDWLVETMVIGTTVFLAWLVSYIVKVIAHAPRPFVVFPQVHALILETKYDSFPSGHATFFFALATAIYLYDKRAGVFFFLCAIVIALGRVTAGVHFPLDIITGALIGIIIAYIVHGMLSNIVTRFKLKSRIG